MTTLEACLIFGGAALAFVVALTYIICTRKRLVEGDPVHDPDPVVRAFSSFLLVFFGPMGGAELGAFLAVIIEHYFLK